MTEELKLFIERNIDMIEAQQWHNLIKKCPVRLTADLFILLRELDPNILKDDRSEGITDNKMYGIKGATRTVSAGAPKNNVYNVLQTTNQGMKGGYQIGYKTIVDALAVCDKLNSDVYRPEYRPYIMEQGTVDGYSWTEVDTVYGKAYVTDRVIHDYDPMTKLRHRAEKKTFDKQVDFIMSVFNAQDTSEEIARVYNINPANVRFSYRAYSTDSNSVLPTRPVLFVDNVKDLVSGFDSQVVLQILNRHSSYEFVKEDNTKPYCVYVLKDNSLLDNIQKAVYDKLGVV